MPLPIHIAAVQYPNEMTSRAANQDKALHLMDDAAHVVDLMVMPEASFSGYWLGKPIEEYAEPILGPTSMIVAQIAVTRNVYICYNIVERDGSSFHNTAVLMGADGRIAGKHRKINLSDADKEAGFSPGEVLQVFNTHVGKVGMLICHDAEDTNNIGELNDRDAEVVLIPCMALADSPEKVDSVAGTWQEVLRANATAGHCYVLWANKIGYASDHICVGSSMILDPQGRVINRGSPDQEEVVRTAATLPRKGVRTAA